MPTDFYDVLGAPADASSEELKRAYRGRVREYHPDVNDHPEGDAQFKLVRKAHDVLSDPAERKDYDRMGHHEYVDKRLDDIPPLTVFPELEDEEPTESASETTVDSPGSVSSESGSTGSRSGRSSSTSSTDTSASASDRSSGNQSTSTAAPSGRGQSQSSSSQSADTSGSGGADQSTATGKSTDTSRSAEHGGSQGTERTTTSRTGSRRSSDTTSAGAERSRDSWDDVTEQTAQSRSAQSSTTAAASRRRGLRRWYGVVLLSLAAYLAGLGTYAAPYVETLSGLATGLTTSPVTTLTGTFPLPSPFNYVLETATAAAAGEPGVGLLLVVGAVALPVVVLTAVAQFGQGSAWIYALASLGPVLPLVAARLATLPTALALLGLVVLPLFSGLGFLVDVGRYLYATR